VLGVLGAYYLAVRTLTETRKNERILIREQASVDSAGDIAVALMTFHDSLNELTWNAGKLAADDNIEVDPQISRLRWPAMSGLSRRTMVHEAMLPRDVAAKADSVRVAMRELP
jgi:hypothetical protein